ncbi:unnamed protein product, partial [Aphanomyces euteiches]
MSQASIVQDRTQFKMTPKGRTFGTFSQEVRPAHPLLGASFLSRVLLTWCSPLLNHRHQLNEDDIWDLEALDKVEGNVGKLGDAFARTKSIFWAGMQVYGGMYFVIGAMNLTAWFVELMRPIVLQKVIESSGDDKNLFLWLLALLFAKVAKGILFSNACVLEQTLCIRFVGALKGLVIKKPLSRSTHRDRSADIDMVNVYTADIDGLTWAALSLINLCILPLYMLAELGLAAVAGIAMIALNLFVGTSVSNFQSTAFGRVSSARDARLGVVKETFESILQVKLHAWEQARLEKIMAMRRW